MDYVKLTNLISELNEFKLGDIVYHRTNPEPGLIMNWRLHGNYQTVDYVVSFGPGNSKVMEEEELTRDKPIL